METRGLNHLKILVRDLDRSTRFYVDALGMKVIDQNPTRVILNTPGRDDTLTLGLVGEDQEAGLDHFGFFLADAATIDGALEQVEQAGGEVIRQTHAGGKRPTAFFKDPDGYLIQI